MTSESSYGKKFLTPKNVFHFLCTSILGLSEEKNSTTLTRNQDECIRACFVILALNFQN